MADFSDKTVIVTGGGQGIGRCIVERFYAEGAHVILAEIDPGRINRAHLAITRSQPGQLTCVQTDLSQEQSVANLIQQTLDLTGQIDHIVHSAAIACNVPVEQLSWNDWKQVLDVNLSGAYLLAHFGARYLRQQNGTMVNIASTRALMSESDTEAYSTSKAGLIGLTHALAISLSPDVRVNCISPGWIDTRHYLDTPGDYPYSISPEDHSQHPAGRIGLPMDVAEMVLYLSSSRAGFITGQNIVIDGGMTRKMIYI